MDERPIRVLIIEDEPSDAALLRLGLTTERRGRTDPPFEVEHAETLAEGLARLAQGGFDAVLLDLGLPDSTGLDSVAPVYRAAPDIPIVVVTGDDDDRVALQAIRQGVQDFLPKEKMDRTSLRRSVLHGIERARLQAQLRQRAAGERSTRQTSERLLERWHEIERMRGEIAEVLALEPPPAPPAEERWLSVDDVAAHLGIKRDTVYKWIKRRGLPGVKMGSLWKFQRSKVDAWLAALQR
jgi:excisionase family DNA binding protein